MLTPAKLKKAAKVCEYYAAQRITLQSACEAGGVPARSFRRWASEVAEVAAMYEKAQLAQGELFKEQLRLKLPNALEKLIDGYEIEETHTEMAPPKDGQPARILSMRKVKKRTGPNVGAVIFALKNIGQGFRDTPTTEMHQHLNVSPGAAPSNAGQGLTDAERDRLAGIQARMLEIAKQRGYTAESFGAAPITQPEEETPDGG